MPEPWLGRSRGGARFCAACGHASGWGELRSGEGPAPIRQVAGETPEETRVVVVMGVSGSGKTTVGRALATARGWRFYDTDDLHPEANVEKMRGGVPLDDEDREPWLRAVSNLVHRSLAEGEEAVIACSALKEAYRERIGAHQPGVTLVHLSGARELLTNRLASRSGHYMPAGLLDSQLDDLEEPVDAVVVDAAAPVSQIVAEVRAIIG